MTTIIIPNWLLYLIMFTWSVSTVLQIVAIVLRWRFRRIVAQLRRDSAKQ